MVRAVLALVLLLAAPTLSFAQSSGSSSSYDPTTLFSGVDLSGFGTAVGTLGAGILLIVLALKAISVVKAAIGKL